MKKSTSLRRWIPILSFKIPLYVRSRFMLSNLLFPLYVFTAPVCPPKSRSHFEKNFRSEERDAILWVKWTMLVGITQNAAFFMLPSRCNIRSPIKKQAFVLDIYYMYYCVSFIWLRYLWDRHRDVALFPCLLRSRKTGSSLRDQSSVEFSLHSEWT